MDNSAPMRSKFNDISNADYDQEIEKCRGKMATITDPQLAAQELYTLARNLETMKGTYSPRPCFEGSCLWMMTPHRNRITRRVTAIREEAAQYGKIADDAQKIKLAEIAYLTAQTRALAPLLQQFSHEKSVPS